MAKKGRGRKARQERAAERLKLAESRTPQEQLARLDKMFGNGKGATKERAKLEKKIEEDN